MSRGDANKLGTNMLDTRDWIVLELGIQITVPLQGNVLAIAPDLLSHYPLWLGLVEKPYIVPSLSTTTTTLVVGIQHLGSNVLVPIQKLVWVSPLLQA